MDKKLSIVVLCGGQSTEHEISVLSANNIVAGIDQEKYHLAVVYITQQGVWHYINDMAAYLTVGPRYLVQQGKTEPVLCQLGASTPSLVTAAAPARVFPVDCFIPMLHGTYGEDGCVQGLLQLMNAAYVGSGVLSSASCMDKVLTKQLLQASGIATTPWQVLTRAEISAKTYQQLTQKLGSELFVKPISLGSSVGISHVKTGAEFLQAVQHVLRYDDRILVEKRIRGREIECAVLGNDDPVASLPSEIISHHDFYSYDAKYLDPKGATTVVPADLPSTLVDRIRQIAVDAFRIMQCRGLLRVDFFMLSEDVILVNEVNTLPGFTSISMYPQMWQASGISYAELLQQLIELALQNHRKQNQLERTYVKHEHTGRTEDQSLS